MHPVTLYLIHSPHGIRIDNRRTARHYLGTTRRDSLMPRMAEHLQAKLKAERGDADCKGHILVKLFAQLTGCATAEEVVEKLVVATWQGTRNDERRLKNLKGLSRICPVCRSAIGLPPFPFKSEIQ